MGGSAHSLPPESLIRGTLAQVAKLVLATPRWWALGLAGFLARGGIVLYVLPILVVPSLVGIATFVGPNAITTSGLSPRFEQVAALTAASTLAALAVGAVVGAAVDIALIREARSEVLAPGAEMDQDTPADASTVRLILRLVAMRIASYLPIATALVLGGARLADIGYHELILPSDLERPFLVRVLTGAPEVSAAVVIVWLLAESVAAIAVRLAVMNQRAAAGSLVDALRLISGQPLRTIWLTVAALVGSVLAVTPGLLAAAVVWQGVRQTLLSGDDGLPAVFVIGTLIVTWAGGLVLAGVASAWRSVAWTAAVARDLRGTGDPAIVGGTL